MYVCVCVCVQVRRRAVVPAFHKQYYEAMCGMFAACTQRTEDKLDKVAGTGQVRDCVCVCVYMCVHVCMYLYTLGGRDWAGTGQDKDRALYMCVCARARCAPMCHSCDVSMCVAHACMCV